MAQYHLSGGKPVSRASGQKVVRSAAYRAGQRLVDDRYGETHDFRRRRGVLHAAIIAPDHAPAWTRHRQALWNEVEKAEKRKDSQLAIPYDIALPHELSLNENIALVRDYLETEFAGRNLVVDVAIHEPDPKKDRRNVHAHLLVPTRPVGPDGFGPKPSTAKSRKEWDNEQHENMLRLRKSWAEHANRHLAAAGFEVRIDHRSLKDQGIDREPTKHRGVASDHMEQRGIATDRGAQYRDIQAQNQPRASALQPELIANPDISLPRPPPSRGRRPRQPPPGKLAPGIEEINDPQNRAQEPMRPAYARMPERPRSRAEGLIRSFRNAARRLALSAGAWRARLMDLWRRVCAELTDDSRHPRIGKRKRKTKAKGKSAAHLPKPPR